jgi:hypothetical protein
VFDQQGTKSGHEISYENTLLKQTLSMRRQRGKLRNNKIESLKNVVLARNFSKGKVRS